MNVGTVYTIKNSQLFSYHIQAIFSWGWTYFIIVFYTIFSLHLFRSNLQGFHLLPTLRPS